MMNWRFLEKVYPPGKVNNHFLGGTHHNCFSFLSHHQQLLINMLWCSAGPGPGAQWQHHSRVLGSTQLPGRQLWGSQAVSSWSGPCKASFCWWVDCQQRFGHHSLVQGRPCLCPSPRTRRWWYQWAACSCSWQGGVVPRTFLWWGIPPGEVPQRSQ